MREDRFHELKKAAKSVPDDMWETVSAFANTDGGHIYLGYTEVKSNNVVKEYRPTGVNNPDKMVKEIIDTTNNKRKISAPVIKEENIKIIKEGNNKSTIEIFVPAVDFNVRQSTEIMWFDDRIIFENPGHLLVSKKEFFDPHGSIPRNELIFQTFVQAKLGEHTGSGGYRILSTMEDLNFRVPDIETDPRKTRLTLWKITPETFKKSLPKEWQKVYQIFNEKLVVTFKDIEPLFEKPWKGHEVLRQMEDADLISKQGKGRATKYVISPDSPKAKLLLNKYVKNIQDSMYD